jgi:hypothetical protein
MLSVMAEARASKDRPREQRQTSSPKGDITMAMAHKTDIERIVRKVLKEEQGDAGEATLQAIRRVSRMLTEEVIPRLPDEQEPEADDESGTVPARATFGSRAPNGDAEGPGIPEDGDEQQPPTDTPESATQAFEQLLKTLSSEQADSLAAFFTAVQNEVRDEDSSEPDPHAA